MAFKKEESKIMFVLFLVGVTIQFGITSAENFDCKGKAFYCLNSTHFMICVDLGDGISRTVEDFLIPCPPPTSCTETNVFECEYHTMTTSDPPIHRSSTDNLIGTSHNSFWEGTDLTTVAPFWYKSEVEISEQYYNTNHPRSENGNEILPIIDMTSMYDITTKQKSSDINTNLENETHRASTINEPTKEFSKDDYNINSSVHIQKPERHELHENTVQYNTEFTNNDQDIETKGITKSTDGFIYITTSPYYEQYFDTVSVTTTSEHTEAELTIVPYISSHQKESSDRSSIYDERNGQITDKANIKNSLNSEGVTRTPVIIKIDGENLGIQTNLEADVTTSSFIGTLYNKQVEINSSEYNDDMKIISNLYADDKNNILNKNTHSTDTDYVTQPWTIMNENLITINPNYNVFDITQSTISTENPLLTSSYVKDNTDINDFYETTVVMETSNGYQTEKHLVPNIHKINDFKFNFNTKPTSNTDIKNKKATSLDNDDSVTNINKQYTIHIKSDKYKLQTNVFSEDMQENVYTNSRTPETENINLDFGKLNTSHSIRDTSTKAIYYLSMENSSAITVNPEHTLPLSTILNNQDATIPINDTRKIKLKNRLIFSKMADSKLKASEPSIVIANTELPYFNDNTQALSQKVNNDYTTTSKYYFNEIIVTKKLNIHDVTTTFTPNLKTDLPFIEAVTETSSTQQKMDAHMQLHQDSSTTVDDENNQMLSYQTTQTYSNKILNVTNGLATTEFKSKLSLNEKSRNNLSLSTQLMSAGAKSLDNNPELSSYSAEMASLSSSNSETLFQTISNEEPSGFKINNFDITPTEMIHNSSSVYKQIKNVPITPSNERTHVLSENIKSSLIFDDTVTVTHGFDNMRTNSLVEKTESTNIINEGTETTVNEGVFGIFPFTYNSNDVTSNTHTEYFPKNVFGSATSVADSLLSRSNSDALGHNTFQQKGINTNVSESYYGTSLPVSYKYDNYIDTMAKTAQSWNTAGHTQNPIKSNQNEIYTSLGEYYPTEPPLGESVSEQSEFPLKIFTDKHYGLTLENNNDYEYFIKTTPTYIKQEVNKNKTSSLPQKNEYVRDMSTHNVTTSNSSTNHGGVIPKNQTENNKLMINNHSIGMIPDTHRNEIEFEYEENQQSTQDLDYKTFSTDANTATDMGLNIQIQENRIQTTPYYEMETGPGKVNISKYKDESHEITGSQQGSTSSNAGNSFDISSNPYLLSRTSIINETDRLKTEYVKIVATTVGNINQENNKNETRSLPQRMRELKINKLIINPNNHVVTLKNQTENDIRNYTINLLPDTNRNVGNENEQSTQDSNFHTFSTDPNTTTELNVNIQIEDYRAHATPDYQGTTSPGEKYRSKYKDGTEQEIAGSQGNIINISSTWFSKDSITTERRENEYSKLTSISGITEGTVRTETIKPYMLKPYNFSAFSLVKKNNEMASIPTVAKPNAYEVINSTLLSGHLSSIKPSQVQNFTKSKTGIGNDYKSNITNSQTIKLPEVPKTETSINTNLYGFNCLNRFRGKYSDANNCQKFYICIGRFYPIVGQCPTNTVFSEDLKQCTRNLSHCIRNNQFQCLRAGRFSDIHDLDSYYICLKNKNKYIRFKLRCQKGYVLNRASVTCIEVTKSLSKQDSNSKSSSSISVDSGSENNGKKPPENYFACVEEGTFADPQDCRTFYVCTKNSKSEFRRRKKKCDSDEIFHKKKKRCVDAESYECDS